MSKRIRHHKKTQPVSQNPTTDLKVGDCIRVKPEVKDPNPDKPEPNRKAKRESCSTGRDPKVPYTSQRLENEVSIKLPQEEVATFPQKYFSTGDIKLILRV